MRKERILHGLVAASLALGAATAAADDFRGFYAGVGAGSNLVELDDLGFDDSDTGFKAFVGYSLGELLAVELAYIDGGEAEESRGLLGSGIFIPGGPLLVPSTTRVVTEVETETFNLSVIGNLPLTESFGLFGRLGYASIDADLTVRLRNGNNTLASASDSESDEEVSYGAGAVYSFGDFFQLRAEYEGFDVSNGSLEFISLSALYRFR